MNIQELDEALAGHELYGDLSDIYAVAQKLHQEDPLHWVQPKDHPPFWAVTKHADIYEIGRRNDIFLNSDQAFLRDNAELAEIMAATTGKKMPLYTLVNMNDPDHRKYRNIIQNYFMPANIRNTQPVVQACARTMVDKLEAVSGASCDFVQDIAVWYPLRFMMGLMNIPEKDYAFLLNMTLRLLAPKAEQTRDKAALVQVVRDYFTYFQGVFEDRRAHPTNDISSLIANAEVDGQLIGAREAISHYVILATAGHDTTSSTLAMAMYQLLKHPDQLERLRQNPELMRQAVEEMFRFASPVKHFVRVAAQDYQIRGKTIRKGDTVALFFHLANLDPEVFEEPTAFRMDRNPNKHIAFGMGAHNCLGQHLARLVIPTFFNELFARVDEMEIIGKPELIASNRVSGLGSLPVRFTFKKAQAA